MGYVVFYVNSFVYIKHVLESNFQKTVDFYEPLS